MGELRLINQRLGHVEERIGHTDQRMDRLETSFSSIKLNIWLAAATTIGLVVAIFRWGTAMFGTGMDAQTIADQSSKSVIQQFQPRLDNVENRLGNLESKFDNLEKQVGEILTVVRAQKNNQPAPASQ